MWLWASSTQANRPLSLDIMRLGKMLGDDITFGSTVYHGARGWASKGMDVYVYRFNVTADQLFLQLSGPTHAFDVPYVFGTFKEFVGACVRACVRAYACVCVRAQRCRRVRVCMCACLRMSTPAPPFMRACMSMPMSPSVCAGVCLCACLCLCARARGSASADTYLAAFKGTRWRSERDEAVSRSMQAYWLSFARDGKPSPAAGTTDPRQVSLHRAIWILSLSNIGGQTQSSACHLTGRSKSPSGARQCAQEISVNPRPYVGNDPAALVPAVVDGP